MRANGAQAVAAQRTGHVAGFFSPAQNKRGAFPVDFADPAQAVGA